MDIQTIFAARCAFALPLQLVQPMLRVRNSTAPDPTAGSRRLAPNRSRAQKPEENSLFYENLGHEEHLKTFKLLIVTTTIYDTQFMHVHLYEFCSPFPYKIRNNLKITIFFCP